MKNRFVKYIQRAKKAMTAKLLISMFIAIMSINLMLILGGNKFVLFLVMTLVNYISIDLVYDYFYLNGKNVYYDISNYLYDLQDVMNNNKRIDSDLKLLITIKILSVRDDFLKNIVTLRFMNYDYYNSITEFNNVNEYAKNTFKIYNEKWEQSEIPNSMIESFNSIHNVSTEKFLGDLKIIIESNDSINDRRKKTSNALKGLMKNSVYEIMELHKIQ